MPGYRLHDVIRRAAGAAGRFAAAADGDVLGRFVADRDAAAFAELVRRHGGMVLAVCRRELGDTPDAEDACQATFLVLARKAAAVRRADAVGGWLYGVARRVARRLGAAAARRRGREAPLADVPGPDTTAAVTWRDGLRALDEELGRLPDAYRAPLVLCYLEGRTQDEAARQLGWSLGAFRGRLERGRARLRDRLTRRGVGLAVLAAAAVGRPVDAAAIPSGIQTSIINTAAAVAAGEAVAAPAGVVAVAEGVIRAMTATKLQWAIGVAAVCGLLTVGGVWATGQGPGAGGPGDEPPPAARPAPLAGGEAKRDAEPDRTAGAAQRRRSMNNLKQIMIAVHNYHDANSRLPADIRGKDGKPLLSWRVEILPYLEQDNLYKQFKLDEPWDSEHNLKLLHHMPVSYRAGIEPKDSTHTYYQAFAGPGTPLHPTVARGGGRPAGPEGLPGVGGPGGGPQGGAGPGGSFPGPGADGPGLPPGQGGGPAVRIGDITDGTSNTLGVVEAGPPVPWTKPADIPFDPQRPVTLVTPFRNEWHAAMMDGSAHALKRDINPFLLRKLIVMNDGEETPRLQGLHAPQPAETEEEKAELRNRIEKNRHVIDQIRRLMGAHADLLADQNGRLGDLGAAEEMAERLKRIEEELEAMNRRLRGDGKPAPPARPKPGP
ncbi:MAG TPA: sigma-70 family RNA polymerase sigma factor [Gemmataceae bacterium]